MTRPSSPTYPAGVSTRLLAIAALMLAAIALLFAFAASQQASAARAHKAACAAISPHRVYAKNHHLNACAARKGSHGKGHKKSGSGGKSKTGAHHAKHAARKHRTTATGPAPNTPGGYTAASCSNGTNATAGEESGFICANGTEPGCPEGFVPAISSDGSTLLCEPEFAEPPSSSGSGDDGEDDPES
jgi:hypothetical protein